ncbi:Fic family protein [uncultured Dysosmobacter sp.]|uniref:Fic/DOC family protein n=1 Tax=uncultured Dysosmobacter sp. TaxID=2591384 RepID=UPI002619C90D|nr:Fic family protein [uncultured Dysosmobacter sp.]
MSDPYLYEDVPVLKNKLDIRDGKTLDLVEAEQSRSNMMLLYEQGFDNFTPSGLCEIHRFLFGDIYDWAGKYRIINIEKREKLLAGRSVWYSSDEYIPRDLDTAFQSIQAQPWEQFSRKEFVSALTRYFPKLWQVHPFREGNTRTIVMLLTFFVEHYGFYMDQELLAASAGYVRDSFVMASLDQFSEYEYLERILLDAVCAEPVLYDAASLEASSEPGTPSEKYKKYQKDKYVPQPHYKREN